MTASSTGPASGTGPSDAELRAQAEAWLAQDPDPATRAELRDLLDAGDTDELARRFDGDLQFGTAGLRGALGAGSLRMNRVVVARAAAGLASYLLQNQAQDEVQGQDQDPEQPSLVIGYDARHNSDVFARDTAQIAQALGVRAILLPEPMPTPVLAFAIGHLGCSAGVMVTASHNPPQDNGYKVYLADTSQIVSPVDAQIAAAIERVGPVDELPRSDDFATAGPEIADAYVRAVVDLIGRPADTDEQARRSGLRAVYTPMHGVGRDIMHRVLADAGFDDVHDVGEQAEPDPDFPTVRFPNPEEPGAMDLALDLAARLEADLIIANDPDADRCAVGVRVPDGSHRMLSGDEVGVLLADHLLRQGKPGVYACSIVSSDLLGRLCSHYERPWRQTLTGFKWIGKLDDLAFGYEEALGYSVAPHIARDKDGVSAALLILQLGSQLRADDQTLLDRLDEIHRRHGVHATDQLSIRVDDPSVITDAMQRLRTRPPESLGGLPVTSFDDLADGYGELPATDGIRIALAETPDGRHRGRIICRPSGTEPKLKCYLEVVEPPSDDLTTSRSRADVSIERLTTDLAASLGVERPR